MNAFWMDLKLAFRGLLRTPGFLVATVLTLALGIGANTSMLSLVDQALWRPLPFHEPERLVVVHEIPPQQPTHLGNFSARNFLDFRSKTNSFTGMAGIQQSSFNLSGDGRAEQVTAARVSANFFDLIGVKPALGRSFLAEEDQVGRERVVLLSHEFWTRRYGSDASLVNRSIRLDGESYQVAGVLPAGFRFPYATGLQDVYVPFAFPAQELKEDSRGNHFFRGVARLKPGATLESAKQDMARVMANLAQTYPDACFGYSAGARPLQSTAIGARRQSQLNVLMVVAALVLVIACVNVASLLLARGLARQQEMAIRASLGADRAQLIHQLLAESLVLALFGGAASVLSSFGFTRGLVALIRLPLNVNPSLDLRGFGFMALITLLACLFFGLLPAWQMSRAELGQAMREGSKGTASKHTHRLRSLLVGAQVALATALMVGAGLMLRNLWHLQSLPLGFEPAHLIKGEMNPPERIYGPDDAKLRALVSGVVSRIEASPGVESVAVSDTLPLGNSDNESSYTVEGETPLPPGVSQDSLVHRITPRFFHTMRIGLKAGRDFTWQEGTTTCAVSDAFVGKHFQGKDAIGKRVRIGDGPWLEIIGVVGSAEQFRPGGVPFPELYLPLQKFTGYSPLQFVVRAAGSPSTVKDTMAKAALAMDADLPMDRIQPVTELVEGSLESDRSQGALLLVFALVALFLAVIGIYGLMSFIARGRTKELGIRTALGATARDLIRLMLGEGARLVALGLVIGLFAAFALSRALASQLEGISTFDLQTYLAVISILGATALFACFIPALRAARVDPAIALRAE
jgi:putative ABC transport system permease protein